MLSPFISFSLFIYLDTTITPTVPQLSVGEHRAFIIKCIIMTFWPSNLGLAGFVHVVKTIVVKTGKNRPVPKPPDWSKPNCYARAESCILHVYLIIIPPYKVHEPFGLGRFATGHSLTKAASRLLFVRVRRLAPQTKTPTSLL